MQLKRQLQGIAKPDNTENSGFDEKANIKTLIESNRPALSPRLPGAPSRIFARYWQPGKVTTSAVETGPDGTAFAKKTLADGTILCGTLRQSDPFDIADIAVWEWGVCGRRTGGPHRE